MTNNEDIFKKVTAHCKEYGFVFQSSEIYDGLAATYDYGPFGSELKNNIKDYFNLNIKHLSSIIEKVEQC